MNRRWLYIALLISIAANLVMGGYYIYKRYYFCHTENTNDTGYFLNRDEVLRHMPNDENEIIFAGDSHMHNFEVAELFRNHLVKNRGINGDNTVGLLNRLDEITESAPEKVFLMIGVNDLGQGQSPAEVADTYEEILQKIQKDSPGTLVYLMSVLPTVSPNGYYSDINNEIIVLNKELKSLAAKYNATWVDLYRHFSENNKLKSEYAADGLHLNGKGYLLLRELLEPYVGD